jgi:hypothetical protein
VNTGGVCLSFAASNCVPSWFCPSM